MLAFENEFLKIYYYHDESLLHVDWLRSVSSEEYRTGVIASFSCLKKYNPVYWLIDVCHLQGIRLSDQQWLQQEMIPQLYGLRVRKLARIGTYDIFNYMSFEDMAQKAAEENTLSIEAAQFTSMEAAKAWLQLYEN